jgi:hypothetical protein
LSPELVALLKRRAGASALRRSPPRSPRSVSVDALLEALPPIRDAALRAQVDGLQSLLARVRSEYGAEPEPPAARGAAAELRALAAPGPVPEPRIAEAEEALGFVLPPALRQAYAEVADGGFGPEGGLYPLARLVAFSRRWERLDRLLPIAGTGPICLDRADGRILRGDGRGRFGEEAESLGAWLALWLYRRAPAPARRRL